jgi:hypothetical protein
MDLRHLSGEQTYAGMITVPVFNLALGLTEANIALDTASGARPDTHSDRERRCAAPRAALCGRGLVRTRQDLRREPQLRSGRAML